MKPTYSFPLLRNIEVKDLSELLKPRIEKFPSKFRKTIADSGWKRINIILSDEIKNGFDDTDLEQQLFEKIVYELPDTIHLLNLSSDVNAQEFYDSFISASVRDRKISNPVRSDEKLISVRKEEDQVIFLFNLGITLLGDNRDQKANLYVPVIFDFNNHKCLIRLRRRQVSRSQLKTKEIIDEVSSYIHQFTNIAINRFNESKLHRDVMYNLFNDEANRAEDIIRNYMDDFSEDQLIEKINHFLTNDLSLSEPNEYIERITSIYYQDLFNNIDESRFNEGYIYGFSFFDRRNNRSSTKNKRQKPIYASKIYWNLKDLIHQHRELTELSLYWKFDKDDFTSSPEGDDFHFVEVNLREIHNTLELRFYRTFSEFRRSQEQYVLYKIMQYL
ncbi:hypothetical protein ACKXGF_04940 [Alkalibacillus sp. S2W]|uniref:hypothetical protein n=1 Tax=Alkalibacillus sp. S2W TaxID=3386553 RepID=UPI00398D040F